MADETDATTDLRTVIRCVLEDSLRPALEDLRRALAGSGPEGEEA